MSLLRLFGSPVLLAEPLAQQPADADPDHGVGEKAMGEKRVEAHAFGNQGTNALVVRW